MTVKFNNSLTQAQYNLLVSGSTVDPGTLYFTTDTKRIFKGAERYSTNSNVIDVQYNSSSKLLTINYVNGSIGQVDIAALLSEKQDKKPNGTDYLIDSNNKINTIYLPDSILGQLINAGSFVPSTAVATLTSAGKSSLGVTTPTITLTNNTAAITGYPANQNHYYVATAAGSFAGITFAVGDWLQATASGWFKVTNTDAVSSVNGKTGAVVLDKNDIGLGNVDNVQQATKTEFDTHVNDAVKHITATERTTWNAKTSVTVENVLNSTSTANALSAAQGKALNDRLVIVETALTWG